MHSTGRFCVGVLLAVALAGFLVAEAGGTLEVPDAVLNEGGNERTAITLSLSNDALGDAVAGTMSSANFQIQPYSSAMRPICPPGEMQNLSVLPPSGDPTFEWDPDIEADWYNVYRELFYEDDLQPPLVFDGYLCRRPDPLTQEDDPEVPPSGKVFAYLVTAENVYYEGTLGTASDGSSRTQGIPCP